MKRKNETVLIILFTFLFLNYNCSRPKKGDIQKDIKAVMIVTDTNLRYDIEVINQTIQSVVDSLDYTIKVNLGKDYTKYSKIFLGDSISDFGHYSDLYEYAGIRIDSIIFSKKNKLKIDIENKQLHYGKEIVLISSYKEYSDFVKSDSIDRVLLVFSRVHFNKKYTEGIFTVDFSCSLNAGSDFTVYVKKGIDRWELKRLFETAVR